MKKPLYYKSEPRRQEFAVEVRQFKDGTCRFFVEWPSDEHSGCPRYAVFEKMSSVFDFLVNNFNS